MFKQPQNVDDATTNLLSRRKFLATAGLAATAVVGGPVLSACSRSAPSTNGRVTINHWTYMDYPDDPTWPSLVKEFNETHKDIFVNSQTFPAKELRTKINTAVATGAAPDTTRVLTYWLGEADRSGWALPLDDYVAKWDGRRDMIESYLEFGRPRPGRPLIYLTHMVAPSCMFYRQDVLQQAGISAPPTTHEELLDAIIKTNAPPSRYGWGMRGDAVGFWPWLPFLKQNGVEVVSDTGEVDLDSPRAIETTKWYLDILLKHHASQPSGVSDGFSPIFALFTAKKLTFATHSILLAPQAKKVEAAHPLVLPRGSVRSWSPAVTTGHSIFRTCKNKEAAWEWISWLNEPAQMKRWTLMDAAWSMPVNKSLESEPDYNTEWFKVPLSNRDSWGTFPTWHPYWAQWQDTDFMPSWQQALMGKVSAEEMLRKFAADFRSKT